MNDKSEKVLKKLEGEGSYFYFVTISVKPETRERFKSFCIAHKTYDKLLNEMMDTYQASKEIQK